MQNALNVRDISALVPMPHLLAVLGFEVNERTSRAACLLHHGSNRSAFTWREDGRWYCFSCGRGGDRITLVRAIRNCTFLEAVQFLAELVGVSYRPRRNTRGDVVEAVRRGERARKAAWQIRDEIVRLRSYYRDGIHRSERLWVRIGEDLFLAGNGPRQDMIWNQMARLASVSTFFVAAYNYIHAANPRELIRFALASPDERRTLILGGFDAASVSQVV